MENYQHLGNIAGPLSPASLWQREGKSLGIDTGADFALLPSV
jgi:hypothetical protein